MTCFCRFIQTFCSILFLLIFFSSSAWSQPTTKELEKFAVQLSKKTDESYTGINELFVMLVDENTGFAKYNTATTYSLLEKLWTAGKNKGDYFVARYNCVKALMLRLIKYYKVDADSKEETKKLLAEAIELAYKTEDDRFIAQVSEYYSQIIWSYGELGLSVIYAKNCIDINEKMNRTPAPIFYQFLSEMQYKIRAYEDCIRYGQKALTLMKNDTFKNIDFHKVNMMNTIALGCHRLHLYDTALTKYHDALNFALSKNDSLWAGIIMGNIAQIYYHQNKLDTAYKMFLFDYEKSKADTFLDNAANSLQWAAKTNLALGNKQKALQQVKEAFELLNKRPDADYLRNAYATTTDIYRALEMYDSAFYFNQLYITLNDSLEKIISISSTSISKARFNDVQSKFAIQSLLRDKRSQILIRNVIIVAIVLASISILLLINKRRMAAKNQMEKLKQEKLMVEQVSKAANEKLVMFTKNIVEKTLLIEKLEHQIKDKLHSEEKQQLISELSQQTILTEDDWQKFKSMFEKVHPQFFPKLKLISPNITLAEQRMGALLRLQLTSKQMASMLGISVDSVHKTKQRLRQRLQLGSEVLLETYFTEI